MAHALPAFPVFDVEGDQHGLNLRWQEYIERFQNFLLALNIKDDTRKRAMLLHFAGEGVYRIFKTLPDTGEPKDLKKRSKNSLVTLHRSKTKSMNVTCSGRPSKILLKA